MYRWEDVVERARTTGEWDEIADGARAGLAAIAELGAPPPEELDAAAREYRYERGLLAADDLDAWLERRGLTVADWHAYLQRALARAAFTGALAQQPVPDDLTWAEGICSGRLEQLAQGAGAARSGRDGSRRVSPGRRHRGGDRPRDPGE